MFSILKRYLSSQDKQVVATFLYSFKRDSIPKNKLEISFCKSSGPGMFHINMSGGQAVNKLSTKAQVKFNITDSKWIPNVIKPKLIELNRNKINSKGEILFSSDRFRSQLSNLEDCLDKVYQCVVDAAYIPPEPSIQQVQKVQKLIKIEKTRSIENKKFMSAKRETRIKIRF